MRLRKLVIKISIATLTFVLVNGVVAALLSLNFIRKIVLDQTSSNLAIDLRQLDTLISTYYQQLTTQARDISANSSLLTAVQLDVPEEIERIALQVAADANLSQVLITNREGQLISEGNKKMSIADNNLLDKEKCLYKDDSGESFLVAHYRLGRNLSDEKDLGYVTVTKSLTNNESFKRWLRKSIDADFSLFSDGNLIMSTLPSGISQATGPLVQENLYEVNNGQYFSRTHRIQGIPQARNLEIHAYVKTTVLNRYIESLRMGIATFLVLSNTLFLCLVYLLYLYHLKRPIDHIIVGTAALAEGNLDAQLALNRRDEWQQVEQAFNEMASKLKDSYSEVKNLNASLEQKVQMRTEDLRLVQQRLQEKNREIIEGISYARRIQNAILPTEQDLSRCFRDHSLVWKPRDLVGGDLIWLLRSRDFTLIATFDCTGHGVAGALMATTAKSLLDRITLDFFLSTPSAILDNLNILLKEFIHSSQSDGRDGLDIGICLIPDDRSELIFAGAKFSLFHLYSGAVEEVRGDRYHIGHPKVPAGFRYSDRHVTLKPDSIFVLVTDGIRDQLGGPQKLPFGKTHGIRHHLSHFHYGQDLDQSVETFMRNFHEYQGDIEQIDDLTIFAFRPRLLGQSSEANEPSSQNAA